MNRFLKTLLPVSLLLAALLAAAVTPAAAQTHNVARTRIVGAVGEPVNPDCAPDNNYEYAGPQGNEMFFPHDGCMAQYNLHPYGIPPEADVRVVQMEFRITGHDGSPMCGRFSFWGRTSGQSPEECRMAGDPPHIVVDVTGSSPSDEDALLVLTWHATSLSIDNAYLAAFTVESLTPVPPPPPCEPQPDCEQPCWPNCQPPCEPQPECEQECYPDCDCDDLVEAAVCGLPGTCTARDLPRCPAPTPFEACGWAYDTAIGLLGDAPAASAEPMSCIPPCVADQGEDCLVQTPCVVGTWGDSTPCLVERHPGCGEACEGCSTLCQQVLSLWWTVCIAFTPAGLVGTVIGIVFPRADSAVTCRTDGLRELADIGIE